MSGSTDPAFTLAAPERPLREVIGTIVREGIRHIFIGPDHILFVLALILFGGRLWSQIKVITALTAAHSAVPRSCPAGAIQEWLGHRNIQHTTRYTELTTHRFRDFWHQED